jgi:hypothetical protein
MPFQPLTVGNVYAAEDQFPARNQLVDIITYSNMNHPRDYIAPLPATKLFVHSPVMNAPLPEPAMRVCGHTRPFRCVPPLETG